MINVQNTNLYIGAKDDLARINSADWAVVHATQTIHYSIFGWDRRQNRPSKEHPNYIVFEDENRLSLNWVDGEARLYEWSGPKVFNQVLDFVAKKISSKKVLIHCDQGQSRSPTLGLLFLSKRLRIIPIDSFQNAKKDFLKIYPYYQPSGIAEYVEANWDKFL